VVAGDRLRETLRPVCDDSDRRQKRLVDRHRGVSRALMRYVQAQPFVLPGFAFDLKDAIEKLVGFDKTTGPAARMILLVRQA
jgi:hypothetical protein